MTLAVDLVPIVSHLGYPANNANGLARACQRRLLDAATCALMASCSSDDAVSLGKPFPSQLMTVQQAAGPRAVVGEVDANAGESNAQADLGL